MPLFYLSYRPDPADLPLICRFDSPADAAAFILGMAGPGLDGISEPDRHRICHYFPEWFGNGSADNSDRQTRAGADPEIPVHGCDTGKKIPGPAGTPAGRFAEGESRENLPAPFPEPDTVRRKAVPGESRNPPFPFQDTTTMMSIPPRDIGILYSQTPAPDPACCTILYRLLRYSICDGLLIEHGTDLLATRDPACFWFRHWTWNGGTWEDRCEFATRNEAAGFIREQLTKPGHASGWNQRGLLEFLPEACQTERTDGQENPCG